MNIICKIHVTLLSIIIFIQSALKLEFMSLDETLTHLSLASHLWDIGKHYSHRCDAAERGIPSGAILFAYRNFIKKWNKILKSHLKWTYPNDNDG